MHNDSCVLICNSGYPQTIAIPIAIHKTIIAVAPVEPEVKMMYAVDSSEIKVDMAGTSLSKPSLESRRRRNR